MTRPFFALALLLAAAAPGRADDPADEALALAPPDPAIVLVVRDLRGHAGRVAASPFWDWVKREAGKDFLASPDFAGIKAAEAFVTGAVGVTPAQIVDDILGDAVVLTYTPPGQGSGEHAALYLRPRSPERLRGVVDKLSALQTATGEVLKVEPRAHAGGSYSARTKPGGGADYIAARGGVFLFTAHEPAVKDFLARAPSAEQADRLARLGVADRLLACVFRPRAFDAELAAKAKGSADPGKRAFLAQFGKVWAAADAVAVTAHVGAGVEVGIRATYRPDALPAEVRALAAAGFGRADERPVPAGSLATLRLRLPVPALLAAAGSFLPADGKKNLDTWVADTVGPAVGRDNLSAVLAGFGPGVALTVDPPTAGWVPGWTLAVALPDAKTHAPVWQAVDTFAHLARFEYNRTHADQLALTGRNPGLPRGLKDSEPGDVLRARVQTVTGPGLPAGVAPSYRIVARHLVVASDPDRVEGFAFNAETPAAPAESDPPLARASGPAVRKYLRDHGPKVADWLAAHDGRPAADVRREFAELAGLLDAIDRADLAADGAPGCAGLTLRLTTAKPLRK